MWRIVNWEREEDGPLTAEFRVDQSGQCSLEKVVNVNEKSCGQTELNYL